MQPDATECVDDFTNGDIHPDGRGNGTVKLGDRALGRRKLRGAAPMTLRDGTCGDVSPRPCP